MSKKTKVDEGETQALCESIQKVQDKIEDIEEEFDAKVLELQAQFNVKKKPLFAERNTIIEKLPNFWYQAFVHHRALNLMLHADDEQIFKYISALQVDEKEDIKSGFKVTITFKENPYFTESELWKEITFTENSKAAVSQSGVTWKPGKNPTANHDAKVGSKRDSSNDSFFTFFETGKNDDIFAANIIKDDLWPNPLRYYLGDDQDDDDFDDEDDDLDEEDDIGPEGGDEEAEEAK